MIIAQEFDVITAYSQLARGPTNLVKQTTLGSAVETNGIGLHTAVPVNVRLTPAPPDIGYVFRRTDLGGFEIPATVESVAHCGYATTLMRTGVMLSTVEHLLSALRGLGVDNVTSMSITSRSLFLTARRKSLQR